VAGALLAGTPDRPLTKDCFLGISFKNKKKDPARKLRGSPHDYGLVVLRGGRLAIHSADPSKARLVIGWHRQPRSSGVGGDPRNVPRKIDVVFLGDVRIDGIEFNDVRRGGILLPDPAVGAKWKHVFYGDNNAAEGQELYRRYDGPAKFKLRG
jgi:hypothetical protein